MRRRKFLAGFASSFAGGVAMAGLPRPAWQSLPQRKAEAEVRGTAKNLIFILLSGAPSHVDTFDLKTGTYTPDFLGVQTYANGLRWPVGIMPKLGQRTDRFSIVRSISAIEAVHDRAIYHMLTGHRVNPALVEEIPHFGSVLSFKLSEQRKPSDSLPTVIRVGNLGPDNGFFDETHFGLVVNSSGQVNQLEHPFAGELDRLGLLNDLLEDVSNVQDSRTKFLSFQGQAQEMMADPELKELFAGDDQNLNNPMDRFRTQCEMAVKVLNADKGARVFQLNLGGWDHHSNIYDNQSPEGLGNLGRTLDNGLAYLLDELASIPGKSSSGSLLDETLIVTVGEFGRTVGSPNSDGGRDHFPYVLPALFAGGGIKAGRQIGASNNSGEFIIDSGWSHNRYMGVNDVVATIFSALGIDWTERFTNTPSGRTFEIVDSTLVGPVYDIDSLFI